MADDLKAKTIKGLIWSGIERLSGQIVTFVLTLILARLVTPNDYGTLAIVMVFITISGFMVDAGFTNALIRKVDCTDTDRSTVLYFNIVVSGVMYGILYLLTPYIASFYHNEALTLLIRCASVVIIINSLSIVQQATLTARIDFKKQTIISLTSSIISGILGIYLAYNGYGVWALIAQTVSLATIKSIMLWCVVRWKPLLVFSKDSFKDLFGYSYKLMLSNLIVSGSNEIIQLMLGKFYSMSSLGHYNYANKIGSFMPTHISNTIQRVLFPVFSQIQEDEEKLAYNFRKSLVLSMALILPLMFCIFALAEPIIKTLLTDEWLPTVPLLRIVAITMALWPLLFFNINVLWVKKRSELSLRLEIINIIIKLSLVVGLYKFNGILGICIALCIAQFINFIIYAIYTARVIPYSVTNQLKDILYLLLAVTAPTLLVYFLILPLVGNVLLQFAIGCSVVFLLFYTMAFAGNRVIREFAAEAKTKLTARLR